MSVLDVNKAITEESLKSIGFFRAAYDVDIEIAIHEYIQVPSYLKFIPLSDNKYSNNGFVSVRISQLIQTVVYLRLLMESVLGLVIKKSILRKTIQRSRRKSG